jgi:hypothetical protein
MMRQIVSAACGLWFCLGAAALAQAEDGVVVEFYTSQGCSSCPPADDFFAELAQQPGVIALALHVDYWDYIGWEDTFGAAQFTERQKNYARAEGSTMIYTPQMIVGGALRVEGNKPDSVAEAVSAVLAQRSPVRLWIERRGDAISIRAEAVPPLATGSTVQVVRYLDQAKVEIERGENAGKSVMYHNIVTSWSKVAEWPGTEALALETLALGPEPVVVIVQGANSGPILAAQRLK